MVGRGKNRIEEELRQQVADLGIERQVVFCGVRTDIGAIMQASDAFLFPSLWEGLPGAVLEARTVGLPVLASDLAGIREIARHLSGMHLLSLSESNERWAAVARKMCLQPKMPEDLKRTPFAIDVASRAFTRVWEHAAGL
jgi:glycosyltransferase involved in cell wall biosynthesis